MGAPRSCACSHLEAPPWLDAFSGAIPASGFQNSFSSRKPFLTMILNQELWGVGSGACNFSTG